MSRATTTAEKLERLSSPEPNTGCWLFIGSSVGPGYGLVKDCRRTVLAHRAAWAIANGPIPKGMVICHGCDVPACVNPAHLVLGTHDSNMKDMVAKGRSLRGAASPARLHPERMPRGEGHRNARLTDEKVRQMRALRGTATLERLGQKFGVSRVSVANVLAGRTWSHVL